MTQERVPRRAMLGRLALILLAIALLAYMVIQGIRIWRGESHPTLLHVGSLNVPWYGAILMSGALCGALLGEFVARRRAVDSEHVWNILLWGLVLGVAVSRLTHVAGAWDHYRSDWLRIIGIENGQFVGLRGLTIHGALAGAVLALVLYAWRSRLNFWFWLDVGAPGFVLGQAVGRWGNFFNQEAYGWRTALPWGLRIPEGARIDALSWLGRILPEYSKLADGSLRCDGPNLACYRDMARFPFETTAFHPTFLYESLLNIGVCLFLVFFLIRRYGHRLVPGEVFMAYGMLYSVVRFGIEFLRVDSAYLGRFPAAQVVSAGLFLLCAGWLVARRWIWKKERAGQPWLP